MLLHVTYIGQSDISCLVSIERYFLCNTRTMWKKGSDQIIYPEHQCVKLTLPLYKKIVILAS